MLKLDRGKTTALGVLFLVLVASVTVPLWSLQGRSEALDELADGHELLTRLEAAQQRAGNRPGAIVQLPTKAPPGAFLNAATSGLASAQLEAYLSQLFQRQQANLISSSVKQADHVETPDILRVQVNLEVAYEALQGLLYELETGTPYVFVDSMSLQPGSAREARTATMKVTLGLRAIWHRPTI
jgi:general secretion pathway protein M